MCESDAKAAEEKSPGIDRFAQRRHLKYQPAGVTFYLLGDQIHDCAEWAWEWGTEAAQKKNHLH